MLSDAPSPRGAEEGQPLQAAAGCFVASEPSGAERVSGSPTCHAHQQTRKAVSGPSVPQMGAKQSKATRVCAYSTLTSGN